MLNGTVINCSMSNALGDGVVATILLGEDGVLLSSATSDPEYANGEDWSMITAATCNVWRACAHNDLSINKITNNVEPEALEQVLIDFGSKKICAMSVGGLAILCVVGFNIEMGFLKLKTAKLQRKLDPILRPVLISCT